MVEIIPKREERTPPVVNLIFWASLVLAVAVAAGIFILQNFQRQQRLAIQQSEQQLLADPSPEQKQLEEDMLSWKQRLDDFKLLADERRTPLPLFSLLETSVHPAVVFTGLTVNLNQNRTLLSGETDSFKHVDEQILLLRQKSEVADLQLVRIELGEGGRVEFSVDFSLEEQVTPKP